MSREDVDSLKEEFDALQNLAAHPNLASAFSMFQDSQFYYMIQELYTGGDFTKLKDRAIKLNVQMDESWWREIFRQSFTGLAHLHGSALMHCDIKEPNLMLKTDRYTRPEVVIIDLGLVRSAASDTNTICGTPGYIAPETWETGKMYPGGDVFALGIVIMQMLLDKVPPHHNPPQCQVLPGGIFTEGANTIQDVQLATSARSPPFNLLSAEFPFLADLTRRLLDKDVSRRPCAKQVLCDAWFRSFGPDDKSDYRDCGGAIDLLLNWLW